MKGERAVCGVVGAWAMREGGRAPYSSPPRSHGHAGLTQGGKSDGRERLRLGCGGADGHLAQQLHAQAQQEQAPVPENGAQRLQQEALHHQHA